MAATVTRDYVQSRWAPGGRPCCRSNARLSEQAGVARRHRLRLLCEQQLAQLLGRQRTAEQIALHLVAAVLAQEAALLLGLHALGDHAQLEPVRQADDGAGDGFVALAAAQVAHEGLVDLERADRE